MKRNTLREKLNAGIPTLGTRIQSTWASITEIIGYSEAFDYVEFLAEYAPFTPFDLENIGRAIELFPHFSGMIKIPQQSRFELALRGMNAGIQNMLFADIRTPADARECTDAVRAESPCAGGQHGVGHGRDSEIVREIGSPAFLQSTKDSVIAIMIEKKEAIENLEAILDVPGIDMVQFGPGDYSMSIGQTGNRNHPAVREAEEYMIATALKKNIIPRAEIPAPDAAEKYLNLGVKHFCMQTDTVILYNWYKKEGKTMKEILGKI